MSDSIQPTSEIWTTAVTAAHDSVPIAVAAKDGSVPYR